MRRWPTTAIVTGQLTAEDGSPVPGARVFIDRVRAGFPGLPVDSACTGFRGVVGEPAITDQTGSFRVQLFGSTFQTISCLHVHAVPPRESLLGPADTVGIILPFRAAAPEADPDSVFVPLIAPRQRP